MAKDIAEGYVTVNPVALKKFSTADLQQLDVEVDKLSREVRGENPPQDDVQAIQKKNRKLQRLQQARLVVQTFRMKNRR